MRKLVFIVSLGLLLLLTPMSALARAGGSTSGHTGGTTSGGGTTTSYDNDYHSHHYYGGANHQTNFFDIIFFGSFGILFFAPGLRRVWLHHQDRQLHPHNTIPVPNELQTEFETFFYRVETAWTQNDQSQLAQLMAPRYFAKQRRILNGYTKQHKIDQLEGLVILDLAQVVTDTPLKIQIVVTAQARDYFHYTNQSAAYNQSVYDNTYIERFTEVWELTRRANQQLVLQKIRQ